MFQEQFHINELAKRLRAEAYSDRVKQVSDGVARAIKTIASWPGYARTPLLELNDVASKTGVGRVFYKDEASRFGLGSFKALGGAYAVSEVLRQHLERKTGSRADPQAMIEGQYRDLLSDITVACATAGNHGRSVAWGAGLFGCRAVIFIHSGVGVDREEAIRRFGADVRRVAGDYDNSVRVAAETAAANGWQVVSDTSYSGYTEIPVTVMQGYTVMFREIEQQLADLPTHVFLQGGVGGLAASAAAYYAGRFGAARPHLVVVEPENADCLLRSAIAGRLVTLRGDFNTRMLGMACGQPSLIAWDILQETADMFVTISEDEAIRAMRDLNNVSVDSIRVVAGECAGAGVAVLQRAAANRRLRKSLALDHRSRVLVIGTEGATDPATYRQITGMSPH